MFPIVILVHEESEDFSGSELSSGSDAEVSLAGTDAGFGKKLKKGFKKTTKKVAKAVNPCPNKDYHVNLCLLMRMNSCEAGVGMAVPVAFAVIIHRQWLPAQCMRCSEGASWATAGHYSTAPPECMQ